MDNEKSINDWISKFILPPGLPPTGTPLDASPRPTPEHMGKRAADYLLTNAVGPGMMDKIPNFGTEEAQTNPSYHWNKPGRKPGKEQESLYSEPIRMEDMQWSEVDPPGGKILKAVKPWKKGIKPAFGKLGKYKDETLHMVGSRNDVHIGLADEIAFDMGAVKTEIVEGHRTPHTAYFKTRKEAQAYKDTIGTSADFIEAETRSLPDTPFAPMHPKVTSYGAGVSEKSAKFRQLAKGAKPVKVKK